jgi:hypothetical protein
VNPPSLAPATWTERYESLRQHVLQGRQVPGTDPLGLILLSRQGVAGWMRGWSQLNAPTLPSPVSPPMLAATGTVPWQNQLTVVLAHMMTAHL